MFLLISALNVWHKRRGDRSEGLSPIRQIMYGFKDMRFRLTKRRSISSFFLSNFTVFLLISGLYFGTQAVVWAHGVEAQILKLKGAVVVTALYDTGEPMSYARVEIWAPHSKIRFQLGRTDRNGKFAFVPDLSGKWRIKISDGLGHCLNLRIPISLENLDTIDRPAPNPSPSTPLRMSKKLKVVLGILMILGVFGWLREICWRYKVSRAK